MAKTKKPYVNPETGYVDFTGPVRQGGFSSVTRAGRLDSQYDIATPAWGDINKYRAERQGFAAELGNASLTATTDFALGFIRTAGTVADLGAWEDLFFGPDEDTGQGNWLTNLAKAGQESMQENFPVYTNGYDRGWFIKGAANTISSAAQFALAGGLIGKGVGALLNYTKIAQASALANAVSQTTGTLASAGALTFAEGMMSGEEVYKQVLREKLSEGFEEKEAHEIASNAMLSTVRANSVNFLLNLTSASKAFNAGLNRGTRGLVDDVLIPNADELFDAAKYAQRLKDYRPVSLKNTFKEMAKEVPQEALEEMINVGSESYGKLQAENEPFKSGFDAFVDGMFSKEGLESAFWGAFGGASQQAITSGINEVSGANKKKAETFKKQLELIQQNIPNVGKTVSNIKGLNDLINLTDSKNFEENKAQVAENLASLNFKAGTGEVLMAQLEGMANASAEELFKYKLIPDTAPQTVANFKKAALESIETTKKLERLYNNSLNMNESLGQSFVDDYYETSVLTKYTIPRALANLDKEIINAKEDLLNKVSIIVGDFSPEIIKEKFPEYFKKVDLIEKEKEELTNVLKETQNKLNVLENTSYRKKYKEGLEKANEAIKKQTETVNRNRQSVNRAAENATNPTTQQQSATTAPAANTVNNNPASTSTSSQAETETEVEKNTSLNWDTNTGEDGTKLEPENPVTSNQEEILKKLDAIHKSVARIKELSYGERKVMDDYYDLLTSNKVRNAKELFELYQKGDLKLINAIDRLLIADIERRRQEKLLGKSFTETTEKVVTGKGQSAGKTVVRFTESKISSDGEVLTIKPKAKFKNEDTSLSTTPETITVKEFREQFYENLSEQDKEMFDEFFTDDSIRIKLVEARIGLKGNAKGQVNIDVESLEGQPFGFELQNGKEINAKYDAELATLEQSLKETPKAETTQSDTEFKKSTSETQLQEPPTNTSSSLAEIPEYKSKNVISEEQKQELISKGFATEVEDVLQGFDVTTPYYIIGNVVFKLEGDTAVEITTNLLNEILEGKSESVEEATSLKTAIIKVNKVPSKLINSFTKGILKIIGNKPVNEITPDDVKNAFFRVLAEKVKNDYNAKDPQVISQAVENLIEDFGVKAVYLVITGNLINSGATELANDLQSLFQLGTRQTSKPIVTTQEEFTSVNKLIVQLAEQRKDRREEDSIAGFKLVSGNTIAYKAVETDKQRTRKSVNTGGNPANSLPLERIVLNSDGEIVSIVESEDAIETISSLTINTDLEVRIDNSFRELLDDPNAVNELPLELWVNRVNKDTGEKESVFVGYLHKPSYYTADTTVSSVLEEVKQQNISTRQSVINSLKNNEIPVIKITNISEGLYEQEFTENEEGNRRFVYRPINEVNNKSGLNSNTGFSYGFVKAKNQVSYAHNGVIKTVKVEDYVVGAPVVIVHDGVPPSVVSTRLATFKSLSKEAKEFVAQKLIDALKGSKEANDFIEAIFIKGSSDKDFTNTFTIRNGILSAQGVTPVSKENADLSTIIDFLEAVENTYEEDYASIFRVNKVSFDNEVARNFLGDNVIRTSIRPIKTKNGLVFKAQNTIDLVLTEPVKPTNDFTDSNEKQPDSSKLPDDVLNLLSGFIESVEENTGQEDSEVESSIDPSLSERTNFLINFNEAQREVIIGNAAHVILSKRDELLQSGNPLSKTEAAAIYKQHIKEFFQTRLSTLYAAIQATNGKTLTKEHQEALENVKKTVSVISNLLNYVDTIYEEASQELINNDFDDVEEIKQDLEGGDNDVMIENRAFTRDGFQSAPAGVRRFLFGLKQLKNVGNKTVVVNDPSTGLVKFYTPKQSYTRIAEILGNSYFPVDDTLNKMLELIKKELDESGKNVEGLDNDSHLLAIYNTISEQVNKIQDSGVAAQFTNQFVKAFYKQVATYYVSYVTKANRYTYYNQNGKNYGFAGLKQIITQSGNSTRLQRTLDILEQKFLSGELEDSSFIVKTINENSFFEKVTLNFDVLTRALTLATSYDVKNKKILEQHKETIRNNISSAFRMIGIDVLPNELFLSSQENNYNDYTNIVAVLQKMNNDAQEGLKNNKDHAVILTEINPFSNQYNYSKEVFKGVAKMLRFIDTPVSTGHRIGGKTYQGNVVHNPVSLTLARLGLIGKTRDEEFIKNFLKDPFSSASSFVNEETFFQAFGYERGLSNFEGESKELTDLEKQEFRINALNYILNNGNEFARSFYDTLSDKSMMPVFEFKRHPLFTDKTAVINPNVRLGLESPFIRYIKGEFNKVLKTRQVFDKATESNDFSYLLEKNHYLVNSEGKKVLGLGGYFTVFSYLNLEHLNNVINASESTDIIAKYTDLRNFLYDSEGNIRQEAIDSVKKDDKKFDNLVLPVLNTEFTKLIKTVRTDFNDYGIFGSNQLSSFVSKASLNKLFTGDNKKDILKDKESFSLFMSSINQVGNINRELKRALNPNSSDDVNIVKAAINMVYGEFNEKATDEVKIVYNNIVSNLERAIAAEYQIQRAIASIEGYMLLGHPSDFSKAVLNKKTGEIDLVTSINNTIDELSKRNARLIASGDKGNFKEGTYRVAVLEDLPVNSPLAPLFKELYGDSAKKYNSGDEPDAQELTTVKEHLDVSLAYGEISPEIYGKLLYILDREAFEEANLESANLIVNKVNSMTEEEKATFLKANPLQPRKPVQITRYFDEQLGQFVTLYIKTSSIPLIPSVIQHNPALKQLLKQMKENKVQRVAFSSGVKNSKTTPVKIINSDGNPNPVMFGKGAIKTLSREDFSIQLNVPFDEAKSKINEGTQYRTLGFVDLQDKEKVDSFLGESTNVGLLRQMYNRVHARMVTLKAKELFKKFGYDVNTRSFFPTSKANLRRISELLVEEAISSGYPQNIVDSLKLNREGEFAIPIQFSPALPVIEPLLLSLVTKGITKTKLRGKSYVQVAETLTRTRKISDLSKNESESIIWLNPKEAKSKNYKLNFTNPNDNSENGTAEILIPFYFQDGKGNLLNASDFVKDGVFDLESFPKELLYINGFRIPTQGANSVNTFKIAGFLPPSMGDAVVVPAEITVQMGSDFDVDKLYAYFRNYKYEDGKIMLDETSLSLDAIDAEDDYMRLSSLVTYINNLVNTGSPTMKSYMTTPLDGIELTSAIDSVKTNEKLLRSVLPYDVVYQTNQYFNNRGGQVGVGITATALTGHAFAQQTNLTLNDAPVTFLTTNEEGETNLISEVPDNALQENVDADTSLGFYRLDKVFARGGKRISYLVSQLLSAAVDNAKDKLLAAAGINNDNFDVLILLTRLGYEFEIGVPFINQPVLKEILYPSNVKGNLYVDGKNIDSISNLRTTLIKWLDSLDVKVEDESKEHPLISYIKSLDYGYENAIDIQKAKEEFVNMLFSNSQGNKVHFTKVENGETVNLLIKDAKTSFLDALDSKKGNSGKEMADFLQRQVDVFNAYNNVKEYAKQIRTLQSYINIGSKGLPTSFSEVSYTVNKIENAKENLNLLSPESLEALLNLGFDNVPEATASTPYNLTYSSALFLYGNDNFFTNSTPAYLNMIKVIESSFSGMLNSEQLERISKEFSLYIAAHAAQRKARQYAISEKPHAEAINLYRTLINKKEIVDKFFLLKNLKLKEDSNHEGTAFSAFFLERSVSKDKATSEKLTADWLAMLNSPDTDVSRFARLLIYDVMSIGGRQDLGNSLYQLIPLNEISKDIELSVKAVDFENPSALLNFAVQFFQNNPDSLYASANFNGYFKDVLKYDFTKSFSPTLEFRNELGIKDGDTLPRFLKGTKWENGKRKIVIFVLQEDFETGVSQYVPHNTYGFGYLTKYEPNPVISNNIKDDSDKRGVKDVADKIKSLNSSSTKEEIKAVALEVSSFLGNEQGYFAEFLADMLDKVDFIFSTNADDSSSYRKGNEVSIGTKQRDDKIVEDFVHEFSHLIIDDKVMQDSQMKEEAISIMKEYEEALSPEDARKAHIFLTYKHLFESSEFKKLFSEYKKINPEGNRIDFLQYVEDADLSTNAIANDVVNLVNSKLAYSKSKGVTFRDVMQMVSDNKIREYRIIGAPLYSVQEFMAEFNGNKEVRKKMRNVITPKGSIYNRYLQAAFEIFKRIYDSINKRFGNYTLEHRTNLLLANVIQSYFPIDSIHEKTPVVTVNENENVVANADVKTETQPFQSNAAQQTGQQPSANTFVFPDGIEIETGNIVLNKEQTEALNLLYEALEVRKEVGFLLQGYAGTGKTTIIKFYLAYLNKKFGVLRGADTVQFSTGSWASLKQLFISVRNYFSNPKGAYKYNFKTIQSFEGVFKKIKITGDNVSVIMEKNKDAYKNIKNKFFSNLLIIDEVSFVSSKTLKIFFEIAKKEGKQIIVMGDPGQIEGVGLGYNELPFNYLYNSGIAKKVLTQEMRQKDDNPSLDVVRKFRDVVASILANEANSQISFKKFFELFDANKMLSKAYEKVVNGKGVLFTGSEGSLASFIENCFKTAQYKEDRSFAKIICYTNEQVELYNKIIREKVFGATDRTYPILEGETITGYDNKMPTPDGGYEFYNSEDYKVKSVKLVQKNIEALKATKKHQELLNDKNLRQLFKMFGVPFKEHSLLGGDLEVFLVNLEENLNFFENPDVEIGLIHTNKQLNSQVRNYYTNFYNLLQVHKSLDVVKNRIYNSPDLNLSRQEMARYYATYKAYDSAITGIFNLYDKIMCNASIKYVNGNLEWTSPNDSTAFYKKAWDYGYAITSDKSQGGTYENTFVDLDNFYGKNNSFIYPKDEKEVRDKVSMVKRLYVAVSRVRSLMYIRNDNALTNESVEENLESSISEYLSTLSKEERENFRLYLQQGLLTYSCK